MLCKWRQVLTQDLNPINTPTAAAPMSSNLSPPASARTSSESSSTTLALPSGGIYNDVELSIFYVSHFPQLVAKQSKGIHFSFQSCFLTTSPPSLSNHLPHPLLIYTDDSFDPVEAITRSCIVRGLVNAENIKQLLPQMTVFLPPASATVSNISLKVVSLSFHSLTRRGNIHRRTRERRGSQHRGGCKRTEAPDFT